MLSNGVLAPFLSIPPLHTIVFAGMEGKRSEKHPRRSSRSDSDPASRQPVGMDIDVLQSMINKAVDFAFAAMDGPVPLVPRGSSQPDPDSDGSDEE